MHDYLKTILLLGILSAFLVVLGGFLGGRDGLYMAFGLSLLINGLAYFFSDKIAIASSGAKEVTRSQAPELYQHVQDLTRKLKMPMPKLYIIPTLQANAFATGRDPSHSRVAVTDGLLKNLSNQEVRAVLAHELGHIKNRDILIASVAAVLASVIGFVSRLGLYNVDEDERPAGLTLLLAFLAPIAAMIIQFAVSREREFEADETGAEILGDGDPLADALLKIHASARKNPMDTNPAFSSLYIANPLGGVGGKLLNLFSTHPPVEERVKRLRRL